MSCSLLIPSNKSVVKTLEDPTLGLYFSECLVGDDPGVAYARNTLADRATTEILVFADDDISVSPLVWDKITRVQPGELYLCEGRVFPISRIMAITKKTLKELGGFDENIRHNGEDLDLFWRALENGVYVNIVPHSLITHQDHPRGNRARAHLESAYVRVKNDKITLEFFVQKNPLIALLRFIGYVFYSLTRARK